MQAYHQKRLIMLLTKKIFQIIILTSICLLHENGYGQKDKTIKNVIGKQISIDSVEAFLNLQMKMLNVPGLSLAIINEGKVVYHLTKGYADIEKKKNVTNNTVFEGASLSKPLFAILIVSMLN